MNSDNKNLIAAVVIGIAVLIGFNLFFDKSPTPESKEQTNVSVLNNVSGAAGATQAPTASPVELDDVPKVASFKTREEIIGSAKRIPIKTPSLKGSIAVKGARLDDLVLTKYHEELSKDSPLVPLLSPADSNQPYFAEFGWVSRDASVSIPTSETLWSGEDHPLTPDTPVTLTWDNGQGLRFERLIEVDDNYVFTIRQKVTNKGMQPVKLHNYGLISRGGTPPVSDFFILYEGPIGYLGGKLYQHDYKALMEEKKIPYDTKSGWLGITDKYWLTALIPDQQTTVKTNFIGRVADGQKKYQTDYIGPVRDIQPGQTVEETVHFFAGAKSLELLDAYSQTLEVPSFDRAVDFGGFYFIFITKPLFYTINYFYDAVGNFGVAILLLTILIRLVFFPLSNKSYKSMARMRKFQPELKKLKERHGDDKVQFQKETMAFYKKHKLNPVSGCLPMLVQIPVFFALYKVLFITLEMRHAPFIWWIKDLSAPDPTNIFTLFGLLPWDPPSWLRVGVLPLLMGLSMFLQQKLNPQPVDSAQQKIFLILPILFTYLLSSFPAGLVLYWTWSNILAMIQQAYIMRRHSEVKSGTPTQRKRLGKK